MDIQAAGSECAPMRARGKALQLLEPPSIALLLLVSFLRTAYRGVELICRVEARVERRLPVSVEEGRSSIWVT